MHVAPDETKSGDFQYICIHCGKHVKELYKRYRSSVLKIQNCEHCQEIADKYVEFEPIIIAVDLMLLERPAYRHILFNTEFKIHWKLNLVILFLNAYIIWSKRINESSNYDNNFTKEKLFYYCFGLALLDNLLLLLLMRASLWISNHYCNSLNHLTVSHTSNLWILLLKSITLANIATFFLLPITIWKESASDLATTLNVLFVQGYLVYGLVHVHSVVSSLQRIYSATAILTSLAIKSIVFEALDNQMKTVFLL